MLIAWAGLPFVLLTLLGPARPMVIGRYLLISLPGIIIYGAIGLDDFLVNSSRSLSTGCAGCASVLAIAAGPMA